MERSNEVKSIIGIVYAILNIGALMLVFGSAYLINTLSTLYGVGLGASIQSNGSGVALTQNAQLLVNELSTIQRSVVESFILLVISLVATGAAFMLLLDRHQKPTRANSKYTFLNGSFSLIYAILFFVASSNLISGSSIYFYIGYIGFFVCVSCDLYIEYLIRAKPIARAAKTKYSMSMDPSKPFANVLSIQDNLFSNMSGNLKIIDKHFNSIALSNFYRLAGKSMGNFKMVLILTSKDMMNSGFEEDIKDLSSELNGSGIDLDVRLMSEKDATEQHERIMMDDKIAYSIPPFNIITKRSEHITKINFKDAIKRFEYMYGRATKLDNYKAEKDRK